MDPLYYKKLLQLYLDNKCSPAEMKELFAFLKEKESNHLLLEQMRDEFDNVFDEKSEKNIEIPFTVQKDPEPAVIPFYKKRWITVLKIPASAKTSSS